MLYIVEGGGCDDTRIADINTDPEVVKLAVDVKTLAMGVERNQELLVELDTDSLPPAIAGAAEVVPPTNGVDVTVGVVEETGEPETATQLALYTVDVGNENVVGKAVCTSTV